MPEFRRPRKGWLRRTWARHPRMAMAVRAALAAAIAWYIARNLPEPAGQYPYYAPMGAVIATSTTLAGSVREALQAVAAIALGGIIATLADTLGNESNPLVLAGAVAVAVLVGGWRRLGPMGSWVPTAALFTLILGGGEAYYAGAYAGLVFLGAAVGLVITMVLPQLPLAPVQEAQDHLRSVLVTKLKNLSGLLDQDGPLDVDEWERLYRDPWPYLREAHSALSEAQEATRGNRRARHYRNAVVALRMQGEALERAAQLVDDMSKVVRDTERADVEVPALGQELRPYAVRTLQAMAEVFDSITGSSADAEAVHRAHESLDALTRASDEVRRRSTPGGGMLAASTIIMDMRRCLDLVKPADEERDVTIEAPTEANKPTEAAGPAEETEATEPTEAAEEAEEAEVTERTGPAGRTQPPAGTATEER